MNAYTTEFFAACPNNGARIKYQLRIQTSEVLMVEAILDAVQSIANGFHEDVADVLFARFGGFQTLVADHHGVTIQTWRHE